MEKINGEALERLMWDHDKALVEALSKEDGFGEEDISGFLIEDASSEERGDLEDDIAIM